MNTIECILKVSSGLLTPITAVVAAYIAWQQHKTAREKLRLDLFERRYRVFRGLMNLLAVVDADGNVSTSDLGNFYGDTAEKRFLFKKEIHEYLKKIREKAVRLRHLNRLLDPQAKTSEERRNAAIDEETER